jgi:hypothetical protein
MPQELSRNERIKEASRYLRGTLAEAVSLAVAASRTGLKSIVFVNTKNDAVSFAGDDLGGSSGLAASLSDL